MNIDFEITGKIAKRNDRELEVRIYFDGVLADNFELDLINKVVTVYPTHKAFRGGETHYTEFENLTLLMKSLGLDVPESYVKHWTPRFYNYYFYLDGAGKVCASNYRKGVSWNHDERVENYNAFPTRALAEKGKNLSKLGRLMLLWQYANDCLYEPDWKQDTEKWFLGYDIFQHQLMYEVTSTMHTDLIYFETKTQLEKFGDMNGMEILRLLGVKS